jgi:hypothetical protein
MDAKCWLLPVASSTAHDLAVRRIVWWPWGRLTEPKEREMTLGDQEAAVRGYESAWNETDADKRMSALELAWADDAVYVDDDVPDGLRGRDALSKYIAEEHEREPGLVITTTRELVILGDRGWLQWTARWATGSQSGTDFIEFAADGRIARLTDFLDADAS